MAEKKVELKPAKKASKELKTYARRARAMREKFSAEGSRFSDPAELVREGRDCRT